MNSSDHRNYRKRVLSHAKNTTALHLDVLLDVKTSVTGHKQRTVGFPQRKHCQGHQQTPQSLSVTTA